MHNTGRQGPSRLSTATCAAAVATTLVTAVAVHVAAQAALPTTPGEAERHAAIAGTPSQSLQLASRDMPARYYRAYRLIGSHVLNLDGQRIGEVAEIVLDGHGDIERMLIALADTHESDGGAIAVPPYRAEVVSTADTRVTVIRIDLSREELIQAQLVRLKSNARAPAQRGAGTPDPHREYGPLY
jgi:ribosomal 30S subunit maturation factor RimM